MRRKQRIEYPGAVYHVVNRGNYRKEYADGNGTDYSYDAAGRILSVSDETETFSYSYTANTRNLLATVTGPAHTVSYLYETGRNAIIGVENKETVGTGTLVSSYTYTYNALGQRVEREQSGTAYPQSSTDVFTYDYLGQVISSNNNFLTGTAFNPTYAYDEMGNRNGNITDLNGATNYSQDLLNQYTAVGPDDPLYDKDGNLTSKGAWTYSWNGENRLSTATDGAESLEFIYDYQGRLVQKTKQTRNKETGGWQTDEILVFTYDGWNRIATTEVDASSSIINSSTFNVWGLDLSGSMQGAGGVGGLLKEGNMYPVYDANGNITQKLDNSGVTLMTVVYDPFGNVISGTLVGEYGFSTKPLVEDIEFYYYGFRYYDPVTGRWPSRDPYKKTEDINRYAFSLNTPVNYWDYLGLSTDKYVPDNSGKHGGPHVDRYNKGGQNVGRYQKDGTPLEHKGKQSPKIPNSDKKKFDKASGRLNAQWGLAALLLAMMMMDVEKNGVSFPANCSIIGDPGEGCPKKWLCTCPSGFAPSDPREFESINRPDANCFDVKAATREINGA